jgi:hypothetical protein
MRHVVRHIGLVVALGLLGAACGSTSAGFSGEAFAVPANRDIAVGEERLLVGVRHLDGTDLGTPDIPVTIEVAPADEPEAVQQAPADFSWIVPDAIGLYRARFTFDRPGTWTVRVIPESGDPIPTTPFTVREQNAAPAVGALAPATATPTLADGPFAAITTDPDPDTRFYELSLDEALRNGRPTVLVFATPAFCQTAACGPLLTNVKDVAPGYPEVNFIHVEVYTNLQDPDFEPDAAHLAESVVQWNLPSEPWGFVIDPDGVIQARFEGTLDPVELIPYLGPPSE